MITIATSIRRSCIGVAMAIGLLAGAPAQPPASSSAPPVAARPRPARSIGGEAGIRWQSMTANQRDALAPLEHEWSTIDAPRKQKWIAIAGRFHKLPAQEQARISRRMTEWARLTPAERGEVRLRYQEARQVPATDRSARWEAYQKLPPGEKQQLAARAVASSAPAVSGGSKTAAASRESTHAKANLVPNPALARPPRAVSPTVVQASPGATTRLITRPNNPPAHQQIGMPKIAATPEFVHRSTLLPRRGPQAAAVLPLSNGPAVAAPQPMLVRAPTVTVAPAAPAASNRPR